MATKVAPPLAPRHLPTCPVRSIGCRGCGRRKRNGGATAPGSWRDPSTWSLLVSVSVTLLVVLVASSIVFVGGWLRLGRPGRPRGLNAAQWLDAVKVGLAVVAGLGAAVGLTVSYRWQRTEKTGIRPSESRSSATVTPRLASCSATTSQQFASLGWWRLPGWPTTGKNSGRPASMCCAPICGCRANPATGHPGEREVRLTILRSIRDHLVPGAPASWQGRDFDFTGATFDGGDFRGAMFSGGAVDFTGAMFSAGTVDFTGAAFSGGAVSFTYAMRAAGVTLGSPLADPIIGLVIAVVILSCCAERHVIPQSRVGGWFCG